jgi:CheY-like chemotaxis protein
MILFYFSFIDSTLGMVDDLTFATTFEAGKLSPLEPRVMNLHSVLMQVKDAVNAVEQKGGRAVPIRIDMQVPAECQNVMVDVCLTRVLYSLLSNAVRYSPITGEYVDITIIYSPGSAAESYETAAADVGCKRVRLATDDSAQKVQIGDFKISFRNSTVVPINLELVRNFFSYYYHFESLAPGELSVPEEEKAMADMIKSSGVSLISKPLASSTASGVGSATKETFRDLSSVKGLGLGLYTSYNMIKILGGHLECSTEGPNQASFCFTLSLPLTSEAAGTSVKRSMLTSMPSIPVSPTASTIMATDNVPMTEDGIAIKAMRVLVVDDSSMCQKVIVKSLKGLEFYTDVASNGKEACDKLQEVPCKFDAVLMDLRMPVMDGLEAIRYSRNVLNLSSLPIIALTAEIGPSIKEEAMKAGASHFLNKPAKGQDIINILKSLMMSTTSA